MSTHASRLAMLRHGDSAFPGGTASFSWGLETLVRDRLVTGAADLEAALGTQLRHRWQCMDRPAVSAAWMADGDLEAIARVDRVLETRTLARELREGSRSAGRAMLSVHVRLGTPGAEPCRQALAAGHGNRGPAGHLAAMQGFLWRACGIGHDDAMLMSAQGFSAAFTSAAVRLGLIGHIDAQAILTRSAACIDGLMGEPMPELDEVHAFAPVAEIAAMRHETGEMRLFSN